jgi:hypothetical protein
MRISFLDNVLFLHLLICFKLFCCCFVWKMWRVEFRFPYTLGWQSEPSEFQLRPSSGVEYWVAWLMHSRRGWHVHGPRSHAWARQLSIQHHYLGVIGILMAQIAIPMCKESGIRPATFSKQNNNKKVTFHKRFLLYLFHFIILSTTKIVAHKTATLFF